MSRFGSDYDNPRLPCMDLVRQGVQGADQQQGPAEHWTVEAQLFEIYQDLEARLHDTALTTSAAGGDWPSMIS